MKRSLALLLAICFLITTPCFAINRTFATGGSEKGLPKTGQTTSYQAGDDGDYEKGLPTAGARYTDNGNGTITDNVTGLMWIKQPELIIPGASVIASNQIQVAHGNYADTHPYVVGDLVSSTGFYVCIIAHTSNGASVAADLVNNPASWIITPWTASAADLTHPATMNWSNSIIDSEALVYAGYSDWRLPNAKELQSIADYGTYSPAINVTFFPNAQSDGYWSGTTCAYYTDGAWVVGFSTGSVYVSGKTSGFYVRPVRSSQ